MKFKLKFTATAKKDLAKLAKKDALRILSKLEFFEKQKDPLKFAGKLVKSNSGEYRFRIGNYRVLFDLENDGSIKILLILVIAHRKDVYKNI